MNEASLVVVRHVPTALNEKKVSRGWLRVPPDPEKLEEMGPGIAKALREHQVQSLASSDLPRALGTAKWLGKELDVPVQGSAELRTWNAGSEVEGKKESETVPIRQKFIKHPDAKPRGGEEFGEFLDRAEPALRELLAHNEKHPEDRKGVVLHGHHMMALEDMFNRRPVDPRRLETLDKDYPPGSVSLLRVHAGGADLQRIHPMGKDEEMRP